LAKNRAVEAKRVRAELGEKYCGENAYRNADQCGDRDHDQSPDDRIPETATQLEAGGRQFGKEIEAQPRAALHDQHVKDGKQRDAGDRC